MVIIFLGRLNSGRYTPKGNKGSFSRLKNNDFSNFFYKS